MSWRRTWRDGGPPPGHGRAAQTRRSARPGRGSQRRRLELGHGGQAAPADINVARFFVYALLGADHDDSPYTHTGERVRHLAVNGIRLVVDELRADVTKMRKDGSRGRPRCSARDSVLSIPSPRVSAGR
jgi:hypothetical protein